MRFRIFFQGTPGPRGDPIIHVFCGRETGAPRENLRRHGEKNIQTLHRKAPAGLGIKPRAFLL